MTDSQRAREPELVGHAQDQLADDAAPEHEMREEGGTGAGIIRSGSPTEDRDAIASAMPAADFDQRASEAQNDEKESDSEPIDGEALALRARPG